MPNLGLAALRERQTAAQRLASQIAKEVREQFLWDLSQGDRYLTYTALAEAFNKLARTEGRTI